MLLGGTERPSVISVPECTPQAFRALLTLSSIHGDDYHASLSYAYTAEAELTEENTLSVLFLAKKYLMEGLRYHALEFAIAHADAFNVLQLLPFARGFEKLEER